VLHEHERVRVSRKNDDETKYQKHLLRPPFVPASDTIHGVVVPAFEILSECFGLMLEGCHFPARFINEDQHGFLRVSVRQRIDARLNIAQRVRTLCGQRPPDGAIVPTDGGRLVTNIVMMGMGEPLYNFEAVRDALLVVADNEGIAISKRKITVSTSGVVPNIKRAGDEIGGMLAVSLHAVRDELRNELVPLNRK